MSENKTPYQQGQERQFRVQLQNALNTQGVDQLKVAQILREQAAHIEAWQKRTVPDAYPALWDHVAAEAYALNNEPSRETQALSDLYVSFHEIGDHPTKSYAAYAVKRLLYALLSNRGVNVDKVLRSANLKAVDVSSRERVIAAGGNPDDEYPF